MRESLLGVARCAICFEKPARQVSAQLLSNARHMGTTRTARESDMRHPHTCVDINSNTGTTCYIETSHAVSAKGLQEIWFECLHLALTFALI